MTRAIAPGLQAALLLARGRTDAIMLVAESAQSDFAAARRSFWAMPLCVPALICLYLADRPEMPSARGLATDLIAFVIVWIGFALLSLRLAERIGRGALWPRFIILWNWCTLVQHLVLVAGTLPAVLGAPDWIGQTASLAAVGWALWLEWFATRLALGLPGLAAAGMVALDLALGLLVAGLTGATG